MAGPLTAKPPARGARSAASAKAKRALAWTHTARFLVTASKLSELPVTELPEVAFVGRSNAGKSTAINALAQQKRLAFASKTPGRTQHINLFELGPKDAPDALFADLPGYGFAAVERRAKLRWQAVMAEYLVARRSLGAIVLLVDSRLGFTEIDCKLLSFIEPRITNGSVKLLVLLTKADKLGRRETSAALERAAEVLQGVASEAADISLVAFSALNGTGLDAVAETIRAWAPPTSGPSQAPVAGEATPPGMSQSK
jgi:GTP-binding protein